LTLKKLDAVTGKPVPNTEFTLKDRDGNVLGKYTTGADGTVTVTGIVPNSTVVVVESKVPVNYVLDSTPSPIIVRNGTGRTVISSLEPGITVTAKEIEVPDGPQSGTEHQHVPQKAQAAFLRFLFSSFFLPFLLFDVGTFLTPKEGRGKCRSPSDPLQIIIN